MAKKKHPFDTVKRSVVKATLFRILTIISDTIIVLALTHRYDLAVGFVVLTNLASTLLYYFHERVWSYVPWGRSVKN